MELNNARLWVDGVPVEPEALQQVRNMAALPILAGHVAVMPDVHLGKGATVGTVIPTRRAVIPAAVGVDIGCFVGETRIPLLNGTQRTLADLARETEPFWVYSVSADLKIVPGRARCVKTRSNAALMRVVVSGGEEILCTPDHEFMLSDGTYRQAKDLRFNDSLMPLYRKWQMRDGYESVSNGKGNSRQTHVLVWEALNGLVPSARIVHHVDHNHFNNAPENLVLMTASEHSTHHRMHGRKFDNRSVEFQQLRQAGIAARKANPVERKKMAEVGSANIRRYMNERPEHFKDAVAGNGERGAPHLRSFNVSPRPCSDCDHVAVNPAALRWHKQREHHYNHKVIAVEPIDRFDDVYCLQVEEHHNFALAAGVFVHNCGMIAARLSLRAEDLPDGLAAVRAQIEREVPIGFAMHGRDSDIDTNWSGHKALRDGWAAIEVEYPKIKTKRQTIAAQLGSLGGGNHFIELCLDEVGDVWVMLHSGSRGAGNAIGQYFIKAAKEECARGHVQLPDDDLAYLPDKTPLFDGYMRAVGWAQDYAFANRAVMMRRVLAALARTIPMPFTVTHEAVNCHHNYVDRENHFGQDMWITRKGAIRARKGDLGIIPGSMGARSYIVRGKGNAASYCSCSHGAGRAMSRSRAGKLFTTTDLRAQTAGVECRKDAGVVDEIPAAYKDIDAVMAAQSDLVEVAHTLKQVLCVKG